ncbi:MAG: histidine kinase [Burkholderiales bacterium]|nr:histidine kinase [Burkholderiales bacterium]
MPSPQGWFARLWYGGLNAEERAEAVALDRRLFSRAGKALWLYIGMLWMSSWGLLQEAQVAAPQGLLGSLLMVCCVLMAMRALWLQPVRTGWQVWVWCLAGVLAAGLFGAVLNGWFEGWQRRRSTAASTALMMLVVVVLNVFPLIRAAQLAHARRLEAERDAAARLAAEARLHLLQAQIQPHFIFNTLAALQHWVDIGDARGPGLLRELTSFLRGSTELLSRDQVTLADELALARHYLAIMQVRLGERLASHIDVAPDCLDQPLPPGLLLTLLENAVEHGIAPSLRPGRITLRAAREPGRFVLTVHDSGAGLAAGWHEGVGLANSRARLAHRFGGGASLTLREASPGTLAQVCIETPA